MRVDLAGLEHFTLESLFFVHDRRGGTFKQKVTAGWSWDHGRFLGLDLFLCGYECRMDGWVRALTSDWEWAIEQAFCGA